MGNAAGSYNGSTHPSGGCYLGPNPSPAALPNTNGVHPAKAGLSWSESRSAAQVPQQDWTPSNKSYQNMEILFNPWVITVGGAILSGLVLYYGFGVGKEKGDKKASSVNHDSPHITAGGNVTAGRDIIIGGNTKTVVDGIKSMPDDHIQVTPQKIFEYLKSLPPLQRKSASHNYQGIKVSWLVKFGNAVSRDDGQLLLITRYLFNYNWVMVTCSVNARSYPKLKIIKDDCEFLIKGTIESIDTTSWTINLKDCRLSL